MLVARSTKPEFKLLTIPPTSQVSYKTVFEIYMIDFGEFLKKMLKKSWNLIVY